MYTRVPYTAIIREPAGSYHVRYLELPQGISTARDEIERGLRVGDDAGCELAALVPGLHATDLPER